MNVPIEVVVNEHVFGGTSHVFREKPESENLLFNDAEI